MIIEHRPCMRCHQNIASVKIMRLMDDSIETEFLCKTCAAGQSRWQKKIPTQLDKILTGILDSSSPPRTPVVPVPTELTCTTCGLPFRSYRETLILGCSDCYKSLEKLLVNDLFKFHGSVSHTGRIPFGHDRTVDLSRNRPDLQRRLTDAIDAEDFVLAARLRDQIRNLES